MDSILTSPLAIRDLNMEVAGRLHDIAIVHDARHARIAYRRAARAVLGLEQPLNEFIAGRSLRDVRYIGPASERIILECLEHGHSPTVERAIEGSGRQAEVEAAHRMRTHFLSRAGALAVLDARLPGAISADEYRGDLQMHSAWSDGAEDIDGLARSARARGYRYIAISDHSYGLAIAGGMSMADARRQHREIDRINRAATDGFRVLKGIEANIPAAGGVDMTEAELSEFEIVLAAPHSRLRIADDQTDRLLTTVRHPVVHVLAHPRGRMYSRQGVLARWTEVFEEAARLGVAIEIDGDPWRQDVDFHLAGMALAAGCRFALDSDAHSGAQLRYMEIALAHARLAGIPADRVINTWPAEKLIEWARGRNAARLSPLDTRRYSGT